MVEDFWPHDCEDYFSINNSFVQSRGTTYVRASSNQLIGIGARALISSRCVNFEYSWLKNILLNNFWWNKAVQLKFSPKSKKEEFQKEQKSYSNTFQQY